ncbi:MAG: beta-lactamase family protein [Ignavibacteria bacterium]|nr:beta-lactamase family protein [Ignavibacteria bacterium]
MKTIRLQIHFCFYILFFFIISDLSFAQSKSNLINKLVQSYYNQGKFIGSVLVADSNRIIFNKGFGYANAELKVKNSPSTKFRIASMTKAFTAVLVLQFVEEGKMHLDSTVSVYLPNYPKENSSRITIRQILSHTAGIPHYQSMPDFFYFNSFLPYKHDEFLKLFWDRELLFEPGTDFSYSSFGYYLLGFILETISGKSYSQLIEVRIFDKLKMNNTSVDNHKTILSNRASGYEKINNELVNANYRNMSTALATGDLISTVGDLYLWDRALYKNALLSAESKALLFRPNLNNYGFGWYNKNVAVPEKDSVRAIYHTGSTNGFRSIIYRLVDKKAVIIILCNLDSSDIYGLSDAIKNILCR